MWGYNLREMGKGLCCKTVGFHSEQVASGGCPREETGSDRNTAPSRLFIEGRMGHDNSRNRNTGEVPSAKDWVPVLTGHDLTRLPLTAREVFVLSFVDGRRTLQAIASLAGLSSDEQFQITHRLVSLGALAPPCEKPMVKLGLSAGLKRIS